MAPALLPPSSLSARDHPARDLAVSPLHPELSQEAVRANEVLFRTLATKRILQKTPWPILRMAFYDLEENSCLAVFVPVSPADNPVWPMRYA